MRQSTRRPLGVAITRVLATALIVVGGFFAFAPSSSATMLPTAATPCPEGEVDSELGCIPIFNPSVTVQASVDCSGKLTGSVTASAGSSAANTFYRNVMIIVVLKDGTKLVDNLFSLPANQAFTALGVSPDDTVTATADFASEFITDFEPVVVSTDVADCQPPTTVPSTTVPPTTLPPTTTVPPTTAPPTTQPPVTTVPPTTVKPPTTTVPATTVPVTTAPPTTLPPTTTVPPTTAPPTTQPPVTTTSPTTTPPTTAPTTGTLPATGAGTTRQQSGLAFVLVIAGVMMLWVSRKRARL